MEYKLLECKRCGNIASVKDNEDPVYICPICGSINDREPNKDYNGVICINSPSMNIKMDEEGKIGIYEDDEDLLHALTILTKYGWKMTFRGTIIEKDATEEDDE